MSNTGSYNPYPQRTRLFEGLRVFFEGFYGLGFRGLRLPLTLTLKGLIFLRAFGPKGPNKGRLWAMLMLRVRVSCKGLEFLPRSLPFVDRSRPIWFQGRKRIESGGVYNRISRYLDPFGGT